MTDPKNDFLIGTNGEAIAPMWPVIITTKQQAYRTIAWIKLLSVVLPDEELASTYEEVEEAIRST